jgi:drug/metabolite transporter (DMT)-like permease
VRGALYGAGAVSIWAGFIVITRLGVTTSLTAFDITAVRFTVAGLILLPLLLRRGLALDRLGWRGFLTLAIGGGAPMVLCVGIGLRFAPAAHAGALFPGMLPVFVALAGVTLGGRQTIGHVLFLTAAVLWASYTVAMRRARLDGLHAAAVAAVASLLVYVPVYALFVDKRLFHAPWRDIIIQGFYQGVLTMVVSLFLYGRAVSLLGASRGAAFGALAPAVAALLAVPVLGEWPTAADWTAIALISAGVYLASGGPLPRR